MEKEAREEMPGFWKQQVSKVGEVYKWSTAWEHRAAGNAKQTAVAG